MSASKVAPPAVVKRGWSTASSALLLDDLGTARVEADLARLAKKHRDESIISAVAHSVHQSATLQAVLENAVDRVDTTSTVWMLRTVFGARPPLPFRCPVSSSPL